MSATAGFSQEAGASIDLSQFSTGEATALAAADEQVVTITAEFTTATDKAPARLFVTALVADGWHIYSVTQAPGGPVPTRIKLDAAEGVRVTSDFQPIEKPHKKREAVFDNLQVETHEGSVTWYAPIELPAGEDPAKLEVQGKFTSMACTEMSCLPPETVPFVAKLGKGRKVPDEAPLARPAGKQSLRQSGSHLTVSGYVEPKVATPGSTVRVVIVAEPAAPYHVYALAGKEPVGLSKPTVIRLTDDQGWKSSQPSPNSSPIKKVSKIAGDVEVQYHEKPVRWVIGLEIPRDVKPGSYTLSGVIGYQTCSDVSCDRPLGAKFEVPVTVGATATAGNTAAQFWPASYADAESSGGTPQPSLSSAQDTSSTDAAALFAGLKPREAGNTNSSLGWMLAAAFLGGVILNFMPCVLPVVGLKLMAFIQQSGHSRGRILALNLWFSLGLMSVFAVLAILATAATLGLRSENLGWGEQFSSTTFNVVMSGLVFAMALSFLGVWEIPIPGFVGGNTANQLAAKEGAAGAFSKGVLSTLLATPCSGPFLGPVFGFTLSQPPMVTYAIFGSIGLGMASPYLLIGAFPGLIRFLPRPGAWMDTFKHIMGFVLLGTVVFLFTSIDKDYLVPTFALLVGIWATCWWIGRTSLTADLGAKLRAWGVGIALTGLAALFSFQWLAPREELLPWQPFSPVALKQLTSEGNTVLVDFTADWCLTCQTNELLAFNTAAVKSKVDSNRIIAMKADWTDGSSEIKEMLALLGSNSIPLCAIFPADRPLEPLVLRDLVTKNQVLRALDEAGASRPEAQTSTAMARP